MSNALNLSIITADYTVTDLTPPVIAYFQIDEATKNQSSVTLRANSISDVDSWISYVDWALEVRRNGILLYDLLFRLNYGESTQTLINSFYVFNLGFTLDTDDVLTGKVIASNAFGRLTIKELTTTVLGVLTLNLSIITADYTVTDLTPPVIVDIAVTDGNDSILQKNATQVKVSAREIYDLGSPLIYVSWAVAINPPDPDNVITWDYFYEELSPPPVGYYNWTGTCVFDVPILNTGDIVVGQIVARDLGNEKEIASLNIIVEGILTLNLAVIDSQYEIFGDTEVPIITDVRLFNILDDLPAIGDTQLKVLANVTDNHWLDLVILRLYVNNLPWQEISIFESAQGLKEGLFAVSSLINGDIIYYQVYARDVSGNEVETEIFQYVIKEDFVIPTIRYEAATDLTGKDLTEGDENIQVSAIVTSLDGLAEVKLYLWINDTQQETKTLFNPANGFQIDSWPTSILVAGDKIDYKITAVSLSGGEAESLLHTVYVLANYIEEDYTFSSIIGK